MLSRAWVLAICVGYFAASVAFAGFMAAQVPFSESAAATFAHVSIIAVGLYAVGAVVPIIIWAFLRFDLNNATGPLVLWGFLILGLCGALYFQVIGPRDLVVHELVTMKDAPAMRASFVANYTRGCVSLQMKDPDNRRMGFNKEQIDWYCHCGADHLLQKATSEDWQSVARTGRLSGSGLDKQKQAAAECIALMRQSGRWPSSNPYADLVSPSGQASQPRSPFGPEWKEIPIDKPPR